MLSHTEMQRKRTLLKTTVSERTKNLLNNFSVFYENNYSSKIGFNEMFAVSNTFLSILGLPSIQSVFRDTPANKEGNVVFFQLTSAAAFLCSLGLINNVIHKWNRNMYEAMESIPLVLSATLTWFGGVLLYSSTKKFEGLLKDIKPSWTKILREGVDDVTILTAKRSIIFTIVYALVMSMAGTVYLMVPFVRTMYNFFTHHDDTNYQFTLKLLPVRYPLRVDTIPGYILCSIFEVTCVFFSVVSIVCIDTLFLQSTTIVCLLLQIVGKKFRQVTLYRNIKTVDQRLLRKLNHIGGQHSELLSYCRRIEEIFNPLILLMMLFTSTNLCVLVITLESRLSLLQLANAIALLTHLVAVVMQPLIYCDSAENISQQTSNIAEMIYSCQWSDQSGEFKKRVLLIMIRSQRTYRFTAYGLFKVNRHLLASLAQTAFNFFKLLRQRKI